MDEREWDAVIAVHLKGHFAPTRRTAGPGCGSWPRRRSRGT